MTLTTYLSDEEADPDEVVKEVIPPTELEDDDDDDDDDDDEDNDTLEEPEE